MKGPEFFIETLALQMEIAIREMNEASDLDERLKQSQIVQNLTASWGNVMSVLQNAAMDKELFGGYDDDFDEEDEYGNKGIPF